MSYIFIAVRSVTSIQLMLQLSHQDVTHNTLYMSHKLRSNTDMCT